MIVLPATIIRVTISVCPTDILGKYLLRNLTSARSPKMTARHRNPKLATMVFSHSPPVWNREVTAWKGRKATRAGTMPK